MIAFIDDHKKQYEIEPICRVLPIVPSTYHEHAARRRDPERRSGRAKRDEALKVEVKRVFDSNFGVYGVRKVWWQLLQVWWQLLREGIAVARCTVERLMRGLGLRGVIRGRPVRTTIGDKAAPCPLDHGVLAASLRKFTLAYCAQSQSPDLFNHRALRKSVDISRLPSATSHVLVTAGLYPRAANALSNS